MSVPDADTLVMATLGVVKVIDAITTVRDRLAASRRYADIVGDHQAGAVSANVLHSVLSNTGYVNRVVWYRTRTSYDTIHHADWGL